MALYREVAKALKAGQMSPATKNIAPLSNTAHVYLYGTPNAMKPWYQDASVGIFRTSRLFRTRCMSISTPR